MENVNAVEAASIPIGVRMKEFEFVETKRAADSKSPIYARIDGHSFSKFTRDLAKPYDLAFMNAMTATTAYLLKETGAQVGYSQSDEISLVWLPSENENSEYIHGGKFQKLGSILAGKATAKFIQEITKTYPEALDKFPHFDARVISLPIEHCAGMLLWRNLDGQKNSVSNIAYNFFSHKSLEKKNSTQRIELLGSDESLAKWLDDEEYRYGIIQFLRATEVPFESAGLPEKAIEFYKKSGKETPVTVTRNILTGYSLPLQDVENRMDFLFRGAEPIMVQTNSIPE